MITAYEIAGILARTVQHGKMDDPELDVARSNPKACQELLEQCRNGETSDKYIFWLEKAKLVS